MGTIITQIQQKIVLLIVTTVIAIITIFSDKIIGDIKFAVNRADLRTATYEKITSSISDYVYNAQDVTEYYDNGWTTKSSLTVVVPPYNSSIVDLRKQEYVTLASLHRFWNKDDMDRFEKVMETVKKIDHEIHSLNSEAEAIVTGKKLNADPKVTKPVVDRLKPLNTELQAQVKLFLIRLF